MMRRLLLIILTVLMSSPSGAEESYYLDTPQCKIYLYNDGDIKATSTEVFRNQILNVKVVPKRPNLVAFKFEGQIYVTSVKCTESADLVAKNEVIKRNAQKTGVNPAKQINFLANKYFIEIDAGFLKVGDESPVSGDYNEVFPSTSTNPTQWQKARNSSYDAGLLISAGFGVRHNAFGFWAFKLRMHNGKKSDSLLLTDLNTSLSQRGTWTYEDSFKNFYGGYKFLFLNDSAWKPLAAFYLGLSSMTSVVSDGDVSLDMSSLGIAALAEVGVEYHLNQSFGLGANLGFEYLGKRSFKFKDESIGKSFKTQMSYNNQFLTLGLKYYF